MSNSHYSDDMPNKNDKPTQDKFFSMRTDEEFESALDDLRGLERPIVARATYLKALVLRLHAEQFRKKRGEKPRRALLPAPSKSST